MVNMICYMGYGLWFINVKVSDDHKRQIARTSGAAYIARGGKYTPFAAALVAPSSARHECGSRTGAGRDSL